MTEKIDQIREDYEAAKQAYNNGLAGLTTRDGLPVYAPDEGKRRRDEIEATYRRAQGDVETAIQNLRSEAEQEIAASGVADPLTRLSTTELEQAGQLRAFIAEDFERLPPGMLAERCKEALASGDRVRVALALRYARQALSVRFTRVGEGYELNGVVAELESIFIDKAKRDAAQARLDASGPLMTSMATDRYLAQAYGHHGVRRGSGR